MMSVVVSHRGAPDLPQAIADIDRIVGLDDTIIESDHHRGDLEGRPWFAHICYSHIGRLTIAPRGHTL